MFLLVMYLVVSLEKTEKNVDNIGEKSKGGKAI